MEELYREIILDHYANPRNKGALEKPTKTAVDWNPLCGDKIKIDLELNSKGTLEQIKFNGEGCAISQASASMLTEKVQGMSAKQIAKLKESDILEMLNVSTSPARKKCALLGWLVLRKALALPKLQSK